MEFMAEGDQDQVFLSPTTSSSFEGKGASNAHGKVSPFSS